MPTRTARPRLLLILFTTLALVGACGEVSEPPGVDSGIDPSTPDASVASADADPLAPDASNDPLASFDDTFDGSDVDAAWMRFQPELVDIAITDGALTLATNQNVNWYNRTQGPLLYKELDGNFMVTSRVRARRASDPDLAPVGKYHFGGLMARRPAAMNDAPNYVFIVVGNDDDISVETKTTVDGQSTFDGPSWGTSDAELRICRIDNTYYMLKRPIDGGTWNNTETYVRSDMTGPVEIGMIAYSPDDDPDLLVSFEEVQFHSVATKTECDE